MVQHLASLTFQCWVLLILPTEDTISGTNKVSEEHNSLGTYEWYFEVIKGVPLLRLKDNSIDGDVL